MLRSKRLFTIVVGIVLQSLVGPSAALSGQDSAVSLLSRKPEPLPTDRVRALRAAPEAANAMASLADRLAVATLNQAVVDSTAVSKGTALRIDVFDDRHYLVTVDAAPRRGATTTLRGRVGDCELASFVLSSHEGLALASLRLPRENLEYYIAYDHQMAEYVLYEIPLDRKPQPRLMGPLSAPPPAEGPERDREAPDGGDFAQPLQATTSSGPGDPAVIDVLVVYTPAAAAWAHLNASSIGNAVNLTMADGQTALDNSLAAVTLNPVGTHEIDYTESGDMASDLYRLTYTGTYTDGWGVVRQCSPFMDEIHALRDDLGADLVTLLVNHANYMPDGTGAAGVAWTYRSEHHPQGVPERGFSVSEIYYYRDYVHIHEIGHNLGAGHHKRQSMQKGPQLFHYSAGWRFNLSGDWYNTVMAYTWGYPHDLGGAAISTRVPYFSSPVIAIGSPAVWIGHSSNGDNASTIRNTKHIVAGYRPTLQDLPPEMGGVLNPFLAATAEMPNRIKLSWSRNPDNDSVMLVWSPNGVFGTPSNGTSYPAGTALPGGGTVLYRGQETLAYHTGLSPFTRYHYKAFSYDSGLRYSFGATASATTLMRVEAFPWTETFEEDSPSLEGWTHTGSYFWTYERGAGSGGPALQHNAFEGVRNARFSGSRNPHTGRLITPVLDIAGLYDPQLSFWYGQQVWAGDQNELKVYYRTDPVSSAWILFFHDPTNRPTWTETTLSLPHPSSQYQIAFEGLDRHGYPNVLDHVTVWGETEPKPKLLVESVVVSPKHSDVGQELTATIRIANQGDLDVTTRFFTDFYAHRTTPPPAGLEGDGTWQTFELDAGATRTFTKTFTPAAAGYYTAWAQVDTTQAVSSRPHYLGPYTYLVAQPAGGLSVKIEPFTARRTGARWRLPSGPDTAWKTSGDVIPDLPVGDYTVRFLNLDGWHTPPDIPVTIRDGRTRIEEAEYVRKTGEVRITLEPAGARDAGARWKLSGGPDVEWKTSGETIAGVPIGKYEVICDDIPGWNTPPEIVIDVGAGRLTQESRQYRLQTGDVQVFVTPRAARDDGAQWRLTSGPDTAWKASGHRIRFLPAGDYTVTFLDLAGWTAPEDTAVVVTDNTLSTREGVYDLQTGSVRVTIQPAGARNDGARWRLTRGPDTAWKSSGQTIDDLPVGTYLLTFNDLPAWRRPVDMDLTIEDGILTLVGGTYIQRTGDLEVVIEPRGAREAGAQWRLTTGPDTGWKDSGQKIRELQIGDYTIAFRSVAGWDRPADIGVRILENDLTTETGTYHLQTGSMRVTIEPRGARDAGAQWRLTSGPDTGWKTSGQTISGLPVGDYTIRFSEVAGWIKPGDTLRTVAKDKTAVYTGTYATHRRDSFELR